MAVRHSRKRNKLQGFLRFIIILGVVIFTIITYFPNQARLQNLRQENTNLVEKIAVLENEINSLEEQIGRLGQDPYIYEKVARDELGNAREGELVIEIKD